MLKSRFYGMQSPCPLVSVIIPVYNDAARLKLCLQALEAQTYPQETYEVLVVDNGSDERIESMVAAFPHAQASYEPQRSSYAARNKGISLSQGEILAFTDSDCIPASDWIERGVANLLGIPNCAIVGGKVALFFKTPDRPTAVELCDSLMHLTQQFFVEKMRFSATANVVTWKRIFEQVGNFDSTLQSGGDKEWGQRVFSQGYTLIYADDVCVNHPARHTFGQLYRKQFRLAGGSPDLIQWRQRLPPLTWNFESIMDHLPALPPVFRVMRFPNVPVATKMATILIWGLMQGIRTSERWRIKLAGLMLKGYDEV